MLHYRWNPNKVVRLEQKYLPVAVSELIYKGQERFHAIVNTGAENGEDLYFESWEER